MIEGGWLPVLSEFIWQSSTGDLEVLNYPKNWNGLKMKVFLGKGCRHIPLLLPFFPVGQGRQREYYRTLLLCRCQKVLPERHSRLDKTGSARQFQERRRRFRDKTASSEFSSFPA